MILRQAFKAWGQIPHNMTLAKNCRGLVERILLKKYGDSDLDKFDRTFADFIFSTSTEITEYKVKVASILVHVLEWGAEQGYCSNPLFDFHIAIPSNKKQPSDDEPLVKVKPEALALRKKAVVSRKARKVRQIDTETLQVLKVWDSINEVDLQLGIRNISRAISRKQTAGGYYWQYDDDTEPFALKKRKTRRREDERIVVSQQSERVEEELKRLATSEEDEPENCRPSDTSLMQATNEEIIAEIRRRGWRGKISFTVSVEL